MTPENCAKKVPSYWEARALLAGVYPQLRRIARGLLRRERRRHTLQPTALANEAVMRLLRREAAGEDPMSVISFGIRELQTILMDSGRHFQTRSRHEDKLSDSG